MTEDEPARWQTRFASYKRALATLEELGNAEDLERLNQLERDGVVKRFELVFELAWKTIADFLVAQGLDNTWGGVSSIIRAGFEAGLLGDGQGWFAAIRVRNEGVHVYDLARADKTIARLPSEFLPLFQAFRDRLEIELK